VVLLGEEIVEQRDIGGADMRFAGRGGCDAYANAGCGSGSAHDVARLDLWRGEPGFEPFHTAERGFPLGWVRPYSARRVKKNSACYRTGQTASRAGTLTMTMRTESGRPTRG